MSKIGLSIIKLFDKEFRTLEKIHKLSSSRSEEAIEKLYRIYYNSNDEYIKNYSLIAITNNYIRLAKGEEALKTLENINLNKLKSTSKEYCDYLICKTEALLLQKSDKKLIENIYNEAQPYLEKFKEDSNIQFIMARFETYAENHDKAIDLYKMIDYSSDINLEYNAKIGLAFEYIHKQDFISAKPLIDECEQIRPNEQLKALKNAVEEKIEENDKIKDIKN